MRKRRKVLVVDDESRNCEIVAEALAGPYSVRTATSAAEALHVAETFEPAYVLLDVMMPGVDGYQICRRLRAQPGGMHLHIIMVTAKGMPSEQAAAYEAGADEYVTKPYDEEDLIQLLREFQASEP